MINLYENRKFLGPLDKAVINSSVFCQKFIKQEILLKYVTEIENMKNYMLNEDISDEDKEITRIMLHQMDIQLEEFLGIKRDGQKKDN